MACSWATIPFNIFSPIPQKRLFSLDKFFSCFSPESSFEPSFTTVLLPPLPLDSVIVRLTSAEEWGWDGIYCGYWCRHRSKDCSKAHHLPSRASTFWVGRVIPKNNLHHDHVCIDEFTQTGATRLLDSDFEKEDAQVHRRRKSLESTKGGSCSNPQKEVAAQVHLGKYSKFGCHESFAASECLM